MSQTERCKKRIGPRFFVGWSRSAQASQDKSPNKLAAVELTAAQARAASKTKARSIGVLIAGKVGFILRIAAVRERL